MTPFRLTLLTLLALIGAMPVAHAAPLACLIEPSQVVDVGSPVMGVLAAVQVERGDLVRKGDTLATLRSDVERANLSAAETRAQLQAEVRAAAAAANLAMAKLQRAQDLRAQNFISQVALEQAQSESDVAQRRVDVARDQQRVAQQDSQTARTQLAQRTIAATLDGVVTARYMNPGERVDDKPVLRIARLDPLRVELVLPLADLGKLKAGDRHRPQAGLPRRPRRASGGRAHRPGGGRRQPHLAGPPDPAQPRPPHPRGRALPGRRARRGTRGGRRHPQRSGWTEGGHPDARRAADRPGGSACGDAHSTTGPGQARLLSPP